MLTSIEEDVINFCEDAIGDSINYEQCNVSLQELDKIKESIADYWTNYKSSTDIAMNELVESIVSIGISPKQNAVFVLISDCSEEKIELFRERIVDSDYIVFENSKEIYSSATSLTSGSQVVIHCEDGDYSYSLGFRCKRLLSNSSYEYGFVTAAHGTHTGALVYTPEMELIGTITKKKFTDGGTVDVAFVKIDTTKYSISNSLLNYTGGSLTSGGVKTNFETTDTVYKVGHETELTAGTITGVGGVVYVKDFRVYIYDVCRATYDSTEGDSGGVVYEKVNDTTRNVAGIHFCTNDEYSFFATIPNIKSELGITLY